MPTLVQFDFPMQGPWGTAMATAFRDLAVIMAGRPVSGGRSGRRTRPTRRAAASTYSRTRTPRYVEEHTARLEGFGVKDIRARVFEVNEPLTEMTRGPLGGA